MDTLTVAMLAGAAGFFVAAALGALALNRGERSLQRARETMERMEAAYNRKQIECSHALGQASTLNDALNNMKAALRETSEALTALQAKAYVRTGRSFHRWTSIHG